jgi:hypothetical protein
MRPIVHVQPLEELERRPRLFAALGRAYGVEFSGTPPADAAAGLIAFGDAAVAIPDGVPVLRLMAAEPIEGTTSTVHFADVSELDRSIRGRTLADRYAARVPPLEPSPGEQVLAACEAGPVWLRDRRSGAERAAVAPAELVDGRPLRDRLRPGAVLPLLPLTVFMQKVAAQHGLLVAPLRASILIDDPNLHRPSYGFIDFRRLAQLAQREGFHVAFATIPLDTWLANRPAVDCFSGPDAPLSLLVHGNDHLHRELARPVDDDTGLRQLAQALRRVARFEARTGLSVSRVMAPPHGACSRETLTRLARVGFDALCASRPAPWLAAGEPVSPLAGWLPADLVEGFPVLPRHSLGADRDEFVLKALLGQPLVAYGHHTDAAGGLEALSELARELGSLGDVRWTSLGEIARTNVEVRELDDLAGVRLFSRKASFELTRPGRVVVEEPDACLELELRAGGRTYAGAGPHELADTGTVEVTAYRGDAVDPAGLREPPWRPWPIGRRLLTEGRDRVIPIARRRRRRRRP